MKFDTVKTLLAIAIALLLAFVCEIIAPESGGRNWISLGVGFVSMFAVILPAMGITFANAQREVSLKIFSWMSAMSVILANVIFSCFEYKVDIYLVVVLFLVVVGWSIIYSLFRAK